MKDIYSLKNMQEKLKEVQGVDLQPMISIAVDTSYHNLGDILLINDIKNKKYFLGIAHDTGAAIKGHPE